MPVQKSCSKFFFNLSVTCLQLLNGHFQFIEQESLREPSQRVHKQVFMRFAKNLLVSNVLCVCGRGGAVLRCHNHELLLTHASGHFTAFLKCYWLIKLFVDRLIMWNKYLINKHSPDKKDNQHDLN